MDFINNSMATTQMIHGELEHIGIHLVVIFASSLAVDDQLGDILSKKPSLPSAGD